MDKRHYDDPLEPIHHHAPMGGRMMTCANVEYPVDKPPKEIRIDDNVWRRIDRDAEDIH